MQDDLKFGYDDRKVFHLQGIILIMEECGANPV